MEKDQTNPWVRANLDAFDVDTLNLIPEGYRPDYERLMKVRQHARAIANLALERVNDSDVECRAFFNWIMRVTGYGPGQDETGYPEDGRTTEFAKDLVDPLTPLGRRVLNEVQARDGR